MTRPLFPRVPADQCSCCGRAIKAGHEIPLIGVVGPKCVLKYGELARVLAQAQGLTLTIDDANNRLAWQLANSLSALGYRECQWERNSDGTMSLNLGTRTRTKVALDESWEQRRARFMADLQIAQGAREAGVAA